MDKKSRELIPPGLVYIADNITSNQNVLGAPKGTALESMMSLIRKMDKSPIGAELPMNLATFQRKIGIDLAGVYRKLLVKDSDSDVQPLRDAVKVLRAFGIDFGYLADDEPCCGALLHYIGLEREFNNRAQEVYEKLKSFRVKKIISIVPSCTYTIRNLVSSRVNGFDLEVKHFLEVVLENIQPYELRFPREAKVVYHDPCQMARYLGLIDEPRQILRAIKGIELVETEWTNGEWATCCGGGGGFEVVFPELSQILAVNRAKELVETGAQIIVTHCPGCIMQLKSGLKELGTDAVEVLDLAQVLAMSMEE